MKVITEGVETLTQRDLLMVADCDFAQGYYFPDPCRLPSLRFS